jgi:hypothetical protein
MGKFEQEASRKVLAGEQILVHTSRSFKDILLWPYKAIMHWQKEREIRKNIWK